MSWNKREERRHYRLVGLYVSLIPKSVDENKLRQHRCILQDFGMGGCDIEMRFFGPAGLVAGHERIRGSGILKAQGGTNRLCEVSVTRSRRGVDE